MRVTKAVLQHKIDYLNRLNRLTEKDWKLSQAYGGYNVVRVVNAKSGETDLFRHQGHVPAKELALKLSAYLNGYCQAKDDVIEEGHYCERCGTHS